MEHPVAKKTPAGKTPAPRKRSKPAPKTGEAKKQTRARGSTPPTGFKSRGVNTRDGVAKETANTPGPAAYRTGDDAGLGPAGADSEGGFLPDEELRKVKTGLSKRDLDHYRRLLLEKRAEIMGDVESLQVDARNNGGNLSNMPLHMADVGSDNFDQEFRLGLVESERRMLDEIDEALIRIQKGTFGVCALMGKPIGKQRLDAKPWAKFCIEAARELEKRGGNGMR